jgi:peptide/nickel transport system substrate-binding protein
MRSRGLHAMLGTAVAAMAFVACGGGDDDKGGSSTTAGAKAGPASIKPGKAGGKLTVLASGDVDYLDPGQDYYTFGYQVQYAVNRMLYSFKPDDSEKPVPDLATGPPEISPDNKTITVHLKKGVKFAPPVNREVKAQDIKYAFERAFSKHVPSSYAGTYFSSIVGTPAKANAGEITPISGIETPDDLTIVFKLKDASAAFVSQALVMPITVPVPEEYAAKFDKGTPSKYDQYAAFTGPYMVRNDAKTGKVVGRSPGKSIDIVRNPNWDKSTDYRPAYLDEISIQEGNDDLTSAARRALQGSHTVCCDTAQPPAQVMKQAVTRSKGQLLQVPSGGILYVSLNTTVKPFDNIDVRKAILAAANRTALRLTTGGAVAGDVASGWIPPGLPGFDAGGGLKQNADLDFLKNPNGDLVLAKKYMLAAKEQDPSLPIDAEGKWTDSGKVLTVGQNADPGRKTTEVFQNQIEQLGFKLNVRVVPVDTMYTKFCSEPQTNVAVCPDVGWFRDFADPQSVLNATFNGDSILEHGNVNWPELDVPAINQAMKAAVAIPVGEQRDKAWAAVNHMVAAQAPGVPYLWPNSAVVQSKDVVGVASGYYGTHDLSFTSVK